MHILTRSCVLYLWIHILTFVKSQDCTLEQFVNGPHYDSNFDTTSMQASYADKKQVRVNCNIGFSGFFKLTCENGNWEPKGTKCQPRSCGHPGDAQFADFQLEKGDDFIFGSRVVYTCHKGYQMVSRSNVRRCMVEGWDGVVPVCEATQCPEIHVDNNVQVIGDVEEATYGNVVRFGCKSNAEILYGSQEIYCDENGEWSGQAPKCAEVKCSVPVIENGEVLGRVTEYKEHETLHFVCNPKYKPTEDRPSKCTKLGQKAEFTPTPVCEQTKCKLQLLQGTRYEPHRNVFLPGETLRVFCGDQHWIVNPQSNSAVFTCGDDGNWDNEPVCKEVTCRRPDDWQLRDGKVREFYGTNWPYWRQRFSLGDTASYSCASGYRRTGGASQATCTRNGWTPNPLCEVISCGPPADVQFADVVLWRGNDYGFNSQVKYTCHQGYQIVRGSDIRRCTERGWDGEAPVCRAATCQKPELPNGFMVGPSHGKLYYTCNEDYKLLTEGWWGEAKCNSDELSEVQCIVKTSCGPIPEIPNGKVTSRSTSYRDREVVEVRCERGSFQQPARLTCRQGEWQSDGGSLKETCKPPGISCSPPPKVENAVIMTSYQKEYFSDTEVTYQCRDTHTLMGGNTIKCNNGNWEKLGTTNENISCTPKRCVNPDDIDNGHYNITKGKDFVFGTQISYFCNEGYHMRSNDFTRTCTLDGWAGHVPQCHLSSCEHPPKGGGVIVKGLPDHEGDPILPDHFLDFICDDPRKHLSGSSRLRCGKDGQWDNPFPSCEVKCTVTKVSRAVLLPTQHAEGAQLSKGQKLNFACRNDKHVIRGNATVECLPNGEWSDIFPTCQSPVGCERPPPLADGRIQGRSKSKYSHNEKVVYTCQQNYVMEGGPHRTCNNGNWTGDLTCLTLVECGRPPPLADADIEGSLKSKYSHNERVEYTCQRYYVMDGGPHRTCSNGKWTGDLRCLKPCTVTDEAMRQHNIAFKFTYKKKLYSSHNDEIEFMCTGGTTLVDTVTLRQTCIDGEIQLPTCQ